MALYRLKKRDSRRSGECSVSISSGGILAVNAMAIRKFELKAGSIELFGDDEIEDKIAFRYVDEMEADVSEVCTFRPQKDPQGKLTAYHASAGSFLGDHPLYEAGETTSYPLHYDPEEEAYYFLLSTGKVTGRRKKVKEKAETVSAATEVSQAAEAEESAA